MVRIVEDVMVEAWYDYPHVLLALLLEDGEAICDDAGWVTTTKRMCIHGHRARVDFEGSELGSAIFVNEEK